MLNNKLSEFLQRESKILSGEFKQASTLGEGTSQEIAEFRENALRSFIERFYPQPYRIVKGKIHDSFSDEPSSSVDCIIVNPAHPNLIDKNGKFQFLFADGIDLVIEVKPDISNQEELFRGLKQCITVKKLRRIKSPILAANFRVPDNVKEFSRQIPFFLFTEKVKQNIKETVNDIKDWYNDNSVPIENQIDAIIVNEIGILNHIKHHHFFYYEWNLDQKDRFGWFIEKWNTITLLGFLLRMEMSYHSNATIQESILKRYLKKFRFDVEKV